MRYIVREYEERLHIKVMTFKSWAKRNYPTITEDTDNGEWCICPEFDDMCSCFLNLIDRISAHEATEQMIDDLLYCIARDNEWGTLIEELEEHAEWFSLLCRRCIDTQYTNAKWQFAAHLHNYRGNDDLKELVYDFLTVEDEYTERLALRALAYIYPDRAGEYAVEFWERDKYKNDETREEYQKMMALEILYQIDSPKLAHYLERAEKLDYKYLREKAKRIRDKISGSETMSESILVVDDEKEIADLLEVYLKNDGYTVYKCYSGADALRCIGGTKLDLAILDVMLPDMDGFRILRKIRERFYFPVIMLTAKVEDGDKIMGLTIGADDYITKPFNPLEVIARVKTQLRRYTRYNHAVHPGEEDTPVAEYDFNGLTINRDTHRCTLYERDIALTPIEFSILWYLCEHRGRVIPSEELFENVWGEKFLDNNNTVMAHIGRLREKLGEPARNPRFIKTVWGVGYTIE